MPPRPARRLGLRRKLLYSAVTLLCCFTLVEVGIRVANRIRVGRWTVADPESAAVNTHLYVPHEWLGQMTRPGARILAKGRHIEINKLGYRGPEIDLRKPPGTFRVACIGGSTTFDVKVSANGKAWPAQLQTVLHDDYGLGRVQVINAATNGYALPRTIIDLATRTLDLQPDWVICYPGVNDLAYAHRRTHQWGRGHEAVKRAKRAALPFWRDLLAYSELHNEIAAAFRYAKQKRFGNWLGRPIERSDEPDPRGIAALRRNLLTLAGICQAHDIRLALVTVRTAYQPDQPRPLQEHLARGDLMDHPTLSLEGHYRGYKTVNHLIRETAKRFDLLLIDQAVALPGGEAHFADSVHFNDAGAAAFARFAAQCIAPRLPVNLAAAD